MKDKLISAEALLLSVRDDPEINPKHFARIKEHIDHAPDVGKHGRWLNWKGEPIQPDEFRWSWTCSECKHELEFEEAVTAEEFPSNYCPNCGAKMDGDGNG